MAQACNLEAQMQQDIEKSVVIRANSLSEVQMKLRMNAEGLQMTETIPNLLEGSRGRTHLNM